MIQNGELIEIHFVYIEQLSLAKNEFRVNKKICNDNRAIHQSDILTSMRGFFGSQSAKIHLHT